MPVVQPDPTPSTPGSSSNLGNEFEAINFGLQGVTALGSAWEQSQALQAQGSFQLNMARINQQFADMQADQVMRQGSAEASKIQRSANATVGAQRASAAAQGIDVNDAEGSAANKVSDTMLASAQDIAQTRNNAWMQAWGIRTQAGLNTISAEFNQKGANFAANQTLLTGALKTASSGFQIAGLYGGSGGGKKEQTPGQLLDKSLANDFTSTATSINQANSTNFVSGAWWQKDSA